MASIAGPVLVAPSGTDRRRKSDHERRMEMTQGAVFVSFTGNLTADPELRFTSSGQAVAGFTVACQKRVKDQNTGEWKDGEATFLRCSVWGQFAENVAESLARGTRVAVTGELRQRNYETREGEKRTVLEVTVETIGPDLRWKIAKVSGADRSQSTPPREPRNDDPWSNPARMPDARYSPPGGFSDEPPF